MDLGDTSNSDVLGKRAFGILTFIFFLLPFLSIVGSIAAWFGNNVILLIMIFLIAVLFCTLTIMGKRVSELLFAIAIISIGISLVWHTTLISTQIVGYDNHLEDYLFRVTSQTGHWNANAFVMTPDYNNYNSMLSITIFPTIISLVTGIDGVWIFKFIYPFIFSFAMLILFLAFKCRIGKTRAFLSVFFIMSISAFFSEVPMAGRQEIAEVFLALIIFLFLDNEIGIRLRFILYMFSTTGLVFSHYGTSFEFLLIMVGGWLLMQFFSRKKIGSNEIPIFKWISFFSFVLILWYFLLAPMGPLYNFVSLASSIVNRFATDLLNPISRDPSVLAGLGLGSYTSLHMIGSAFFLLTELFILIGVVKFFRSTDKLGKEMTFMNLSALGVLFAGIVVPFFAQAFNMTRLYHIALFFLAPACIHGCEAAFNAFAKGIGGLYARILGLGHVTVFSKRSFLPLVSVILVFLFLFQVGFIYEITGIEVSSTALSAQKIDKVVLYNSVTTYAEVFSAKWLRSATSEASLIYADYPAKMHVLTSYGMLLRDRIVTIVTNNSIYPPEKPGENIDIYLRTLNVAYNRIVGYYHYIWNTTEIVPILNKMNKLYSNGESDIYSNLID